MLLIQEIRKGINSRHIIRDVMDSSNYYNSHLLFQHGQFLKALSWQANDKLEIKSYMYGILNNLGSFRIEKFTLETKKRLLNYCAISVRLHDSEC